MDSSANRVIQEYLIYCDCKATATEFSKECQDSNLPLPLTESLEGNNATQRFMSAANQGDRDLFFALWDDRFPLESRESDKSLQKIEFLMNVYFAVYPLLEQPKSDVILVLMSGSKCVGIDGCV